MLNNLADWPNRIVRTGVKPADQFLAHPDNARLHSRYQRAVIRGLLNKVGWVGMVMESERSGYLLDGHDRIFEALAKGDSTPVPYYTVDVTESEESVILAAYDASGALAQYDAGAVASLLSRVQTGDSAVESLLRSIAERAIEPVHPFLDPANIPNNSESAPLSAYDRFKPALGDIWQAGGHTLNVKDSREFNGHKIIPNLSMIYADPPSGVASIGVPYFRGTVYAMTNPGILSIALENLKGDKNQTGVIVWHKITGPFAATPGRWGDSAEFIAYSMTPGAVFNIPQYAPAGNVWTIPADLTPLTPDGQPVALLVRMIATSTAPGDSVLDLFAGSGPTFVAAHMLGRRCIGYEIDPVRAAIILDRLAGLGLMPERVHHD